MSAQGELRNLDLKRRMDARSRARAALLPDQRAYLAAKAREDAAIAEYDQLQAKPILAAPQKVVARAPLPSMASLAFVQRLAGFDRAAAATTAITYGRPHA